eukprot:176150-Pyramimonas_sp.AAC.1
MRPARRRSGAAKGVPGPRCPQLFPQVSDALKRGRLRRHWRVSCPRKLAHKRPRLQESVPRWQPA